MMPIDCSIVVHTEVLTAVYVKSNKFIWSMVITRTMDAMQALFHVILISETLMSRMGRWGRIAKRTKDRAETPWSGKASDEI